MQLRGTITKHAYRDLLYIFGRSYDTNVNSATGAESTTAASEIDSRTGESNEDFERAKITFKE